MIFFIKEGLGSGSLDNLLAVAQFDLVAAARFYSNVAVAIQPFGVWRLSPKV